MGGAKKPRQQGPQYPLVIETFQDPRWSLDRVQSDPSCINGDVRLERYRITVEKIEEPVEVLRERLIKLWRESERNTHYWEPMRRRGAELGLTRDDLKVDDQGSDYRGNR